MTIAVDLGRKAAKKKKKKKKKRVKAFLTHIISGPNTMCTHQILYVYYPITIINPLVLHLKMSICLIVSALEILYREKYLTKITDITYVLIVLALLLTLCVMETTTWVL